MSRHEFYCSRCQSRLAKVDEPDHVQRIEAARFAYNVRYGSLTLHCACGYVKTISVPRKVDVFSGKPTSEEAA